MSKVASEIKVAAHQSPRNAPRPADKAGRDPFASLLDTLSPSEKPAAKPDRSAPVKESRKPDASDNRSPADDPAPATTDTNAAADTPVSSDQNSDKPAETTASAETAPEETAQQPDTIDADLLAALDIALAAPAPQPVAAAIAITPALAPADAAPVSATAEQSAPAIAAAAAATLQAPAEEIATPVLPQADAADASDTDTKPVAKSETHGTEQPKEAKFDAAIAQKQPQDGSQKKSGEHHAANPQAVEQKPAPVVTEAKTETSTDLDSSLKAAQPAAPDSTATFTLPTLHAHVSAQAGATAQTATQVANAVPVSGIAVEIAAQAKAGGHRFDIRLDPPELGRIDVRLDVDKTGQVTTHLRVDRVETLDMLRRDSHSLERALQDAGLKTSDNALNFSLRDQSQQQQAREQNTPNARQFIATDENAPAIGGAQVSAWASRLGGIDIRV